MAKDFKLKWKPKIKDFNLPSGIDYNVQNRRQHPECRENEVFFSNHNTGEDYLEKYPHLLSLRCGKQAYDSKDRPLAQDWLKPWFIDKNEYITHCKQSLKL